MDQARSDTDVTGALGTRPRAFSTFEFLRGIAAIFVVLNHATQFYHVEGVFSHGYLAVDFFFMLSGFVMAHAFEGPLADGVSPSRCFWRRVCRLWPTMAFGILLGAIVDQAAGSAFTTTSARAISQFVFVPVLSSQTGTYPLDGVQWSLFFELVANAVHFFLLRHVSTRVLAIWVVVMAAIVFVIAFHFGAIAVGDRPTNWTWGFGRVAFPYGIGMLLCRLWRRPAISPRWAVVTLSLPLILATASFQPLAHQWWSDPLVVIGIMPVILWYAASAVVPVRLAPLAAWLGRVSFPIYAFHLPLIALGELANTLDGGHWAFEIRVLALAAVVVVSRSWMVIEAKRRASAHVSEMEADAKSGRIMTSSTIASWTSQRATL